MKIKQIDRETCRFVREAIDENLAEFAAEYGLSIKAGNGRFDSEQVTFKVECAVIDNDGTVHTKAASDFKRNAYRWGLKSSDLGRVFQTYDGKRFTIVGLKPRSLTYPILASNDKGTVYKFSAREVRDGLDKVAKTA